MLIRVSLSIPGLAPCAAFEEPHKKQMADLHDIRDTPLVPRGHGSGYYSIVLCFGKQDVPQQQVSHN